VSYGIQTKRVTINPAMLDLDDAAIDWSDPLAYPGRRRRARSWILEPWDELTGDDLDVPRGRWDRIGRHPQEDG
jgi:hypothetical protein